MIIWKGEKDMFKDWSRNACPIIPTNLTDFANAGIAATVRAHTPPNEFARLHKFRPTGGILCFSNQKCAWDLPTKRDLKKGGKADIGLIQLGLRILALNSQQLESVGVDTILLPKIGSGLGHIPWQDVWDEISDIVAVIADQFTVNIYAEETNERIRIEIAV